MRLFVLYNDKPVYISHSDAEFVSRYDLLLKYGKNFTLKSCEGKVFSVNDVKAEPSHDNRIAGMIIGGIAGIFLMPFFPPSPFFTAGLAYLYESAKFEREEKLANHFNNHLIDTEVINIITNPKPTA